MDWICAFTSIGYEDFLKRVFCIGKKRFTLNLTKAEPD